MQGLSSLPSIDFFAFVAEIEQIHQRSRSKLQGEEGSLSEPEEPQHFASFLSETESSPPKPQGPLHAASSVAGLDRTSFERHEPPHSLSSSLDPSHALSELFEQQYDEDDLSSDEPPPLSLLYQEELDSQELEATPICDLNEIERSLSLLEASPFELFQEALKYLNENDVYIKSLALTYVKKVVDCSENKWKKDGQSQLDVRRSRSMAACYVAEAHQSGVGLEQSDDLAMTYYKIAMRKLSAGKNSVIGDNYLKAASHQRRLAERSQDAKRLLECTQWLKQSVEAEYSPTSDKASAVWFDVADIYWQLANSPSCEISEEKIKTYKIEAYKSCLRALEIDEKIHGQRQMIIAIRNIPKSIDRAKRKALVIFGHLFFKGYYPQNSVYEETDSMLSFMCYKKAFEAGHIKSLSYAIAACIFRQDEENKNDAEDLLGQTVAYISQSTDRKREKLIKFFNDSQQKFLERWPTSTAQSPTSSSKRQRRI